MSPCASNTSATFAAPAHGSTGLTATGVHPVSRLRTADFRPAHQSDAFAFRPWTVDCGPWTSNSPPHENSSRRMNTAATNNARVVSRTNNASINRKPMPASSNVLISQHGNLDAEYVDETDARFA